MKTFRAIPAVKFSFPRRLAAFAVTAATLLGFALTMPQAAQAGNTCSSPKVNPGCVVQGIPVHFYNRTGDRLAFRISSGGRGDAILGGYSEHRDAGSTVPGIDMTVVIYNTVGLNIASNTHHVPITAFRECEVNAVESGHGPVLVILCF